MIAAVSESPPRESRMPPSDSPAPRVRSRMPGREFAPVISPAMRKAGTRYIPRPPVQSVWPCTTSTSRRKGRTPSRTALVTVQFQQLSDDLRPIGTLTVLAEWEWGEKEILRTVIAKGLLEKSWDFVPVGNRLRFDLTFLMERALLHRVKDWSPPELRRFWFDKPMLDLGPVLVLMNA